MPTWLISQIIITVFIVYLWKMIYDRKLWTSGFPFGRKHMLQLTWLLFFPVSWFFALVVFGLIYMYFTSETNQNIWYFVVWIPSVLFIVLVLVYIVLYLKRKRKDQDIESKIAYKRAECIEWIKRFTFLSENNTKLQISISNGNPVGKIIISQITEEEERRLIPYEEDLPEGISLFVIR